MSTSKCLGCGKVRVMPGKYVRCAKCLERLRKQIDRIMEKATGRTSYVNQ